MATTWKRWQQADVVRLCRLYLADTPMPELLAAFPGRTADGITKKANENGAYRSDDYRAETGRKGGLLTPSQPRPTSEDLKRGWEKRRRTMAAQQQSRPFAP